METVQEELSLKWFRVIIQPTEGLDIRMGVINLKWIAILKSKFVPVLLDQDRVLNSPAMIRV